MNDLKTIESAIQRLEAMYDCNHEVMDADDCGDLLGTITDLKLMRCHLLHEDYKEKVIAFRDYVVSTMPDVTDDDNGQKQWEDFCGMRWTISFGDQEVTLQNGADTWQPIVDMLNGHIDEI